MEDKEESDDNGEECNNANEEEKGDGNDNNHAKKEEEGDGHEDGKEGNDNGEERTTTTGRNG